MENSRTKYHFRKKYRKHFLRVRQIINEIDPIGLIELYGSEEYDPKVEDIMTRLNDSNTSRELKEIVIAVFTRWFDNSGNLEFYEKVGEQLLEVKKTWNPD